MIWFILILIVVLLLFFVHIFKVPKVGNMVLITGGIKTGKSTLSVHMVFRQYRKQLIKYYIKLVFFKIFRFFKISKFVNSPLPEKPLIYSNIPLRCTYVPMTKSLLLRQERFVYGSVVYLCESSLIADSMSFKDLTVNENLLLFNKLFAHETKGGYVFYDTQSIGDNHYAVKRCLSSYLYIHHTIKIPFFCLMWVRELKYNEDGSQVNTYSNDVEDDLKLIIVPKRVWKKFDCYAYSVLTDDLPVNNRTVFPVCLKAEDIISFKEYKNLKNGGVKNDKISKKS